jgi:protein pelota|tara:strand:- start:4032 stop:5096 length:1065 start_codon:yes stop_codon:yes gene_type:complete
MKILKREPTMWRLRIESEDDLWTLSHLARPGLSIGMLGERRDQTTSGEEGGRAKVAERKKMWIRLKIGTTEYQAFSELLRVHGVIEEAQFDVGLHHTHIVELRDDVELTATHAFSQADYELLRQSEKAAQQTNIALAMVETDEIVLFYITPRGLKEGATWTMRGGGKRGDIKQSSGVAATFRNNVIKAVTATLDESTPLLLCGPGHPRDVLLNDMKASGQTRFMKSIATSMAGRAGANELLREGLAGDLLSEYAISKETSLLDEAWTRLSTNGAVAYGPSALAKAMDEGAIEVFLITADLLRNQDQRINGKSWALWTEGLADIGATMVQCSVDHDAGQQLVGMGGAIALLRYAM